MDILCLTELKLNEKFISIACLNKVKRYPEYRPTTINNASY